MSFGSTYSGEGTALIVGNNSSTEQTFTSSYTWKLSPDATSYTYAVINYENSIIGKKKLSAVYSYAYFPGANWVETSSNGCLNFNTAYYYDSDTNTSFIWVTINGVYNKLNYSSEELDILVVEPSSASVKEELKKRSRSTEEFKKLLESRSHLKKIYLKLKDKLKK